nr:flagellar export protein FliJ [Lachnospiraceae bacterium]
KVVQERKTIEKLREKKFEEYLKEIDAEERKTVDELVSYRYTSGEKND